jgi:hypothetical protein
MATPRKNKSTGQKSDERPFDDKQDQFNAMIAEGATWRMCAARLKVSTATFSKWIAGDPDLEKQYAHALEAQGDDYAFKVIETAEDPVLDPNEKRVRIDAYKWAAGKRKPKVYGDRQQMELSGPNGKPIETSTRIELVSPGWNDEVDQG